MTYHRQRQIFGGVSISSIFESKLKSIVSKIYSEGENYLLNVNEDEYLNYTLDEYFINPPVILFDNVYIESIERNIPAEEHPLYVRHRFEANEKIKVLIIKYSIECSGEVELLNYSPASKFTMSGGANFKVESISIATEVIKLTDNPDEIKTQFNREVAGIKANYETLTEDILKFNSQLKAKSIVEFNKRKQEILRKHNFVASLGVPLKHMENTPKTFSIPSPAMRKSIIIKPVVYDKGFKPEPTLEDTDYETILKYINDVGKVFERLPNLYKGKREEFLRDHILMILDPHFRMGSATGETFNKSGKTDILIRYNSSVVFIAECKFWTGEKGYLNSISQLLQYLTWRDTKCAIVVFVKQKEISGILAKISSTSSSHSNFIRIEKKTDENWFNFIFHLNGDKNRHLKLAVMIYHLPKN